MKELFYSDYEDFVSEIVESYEDIQHKKYDNSGVIIVANYEDLGSILAELLQYGYELGKFDISKYYNDHEYYVEIYDDQISVESVWHDEYYIGKKLYKAGYKWCTGEEFYLLGDVNSAIIKSLDDGECYAVYIDEDFEDVNECDDCDNTACAVHPEYKSSVSVKVNGKEITNPDEAMDVVADILGKYKKFSMFAPWF